MKAVNFPKSITIRLNEDQLDRLMMKPILMGKPNLSMLEALYVGVKHQFII